MDAKLQGLERAARAGDIDAKTNLLKAQLRIGRVTMDRLRLASYLGDIASRNVVGKCVTCEDTRMVSPPTEGRRKGDKRYGEGCATCGLGEHATGRWIRRLNNVYEGQEEDRVFLARCALAAARCAFPGWSRRQDCDGTGKQPILNHYDNTPTGNYLHHNCYCCMYVREILVTAAGWILCPCAKHSSAAHMATMANGRSGSPTRMFYNAPWLALSGDWTQACMALVTDQTSCTRYSTERAVREAICKSVSPWLLGETTDGLG